MQCPRHSPLPRLVFPDEDSRLLLSPPRRCSRKEKTGSQALHHSKAEIPPSKAHSDQDAHGGRKKEDEMGKEVVVSDTEGRNTVKKDDYTKSSFLETLPTASALMPRLAAWREQRRITVGTKRSTGKRVLSEGGAEEMSSRKRNRKMSLLGDLSEGRKEYDSTKTLARIFRR